MIKTLLKDGAKRLLCLVTLGMTQWGHAGDLDLQFKAEEQGAWKLDRKVPDRPSLVFPESGKDGGLRSTSEGFDLLSREWPIGTKAFEISADLEMTRGRAEVFNRGRGFAITLSSAPVAEMKPEDLALIFAVTQTGVIAVVKKGGSRYGVEKRPGLYSFGGQDVGERFEMSMAGGGGQDFSVRWPTKILRGTKIRFWAARWPDGKIKLAIYNGDGAAAPWWEAETVLPESLRTVPLNLLTLHTGREGADFGDLGKFSLAEGQGSGPADAILTRLQMRELGTEGKPVLNKPFPAAVLAAPAGWNVGSRLLGADGLARLRKKFNDPRFAAYKTVIIRNASQEQVAKAKLGQPDQNEALVALTWAYLLTGDKDAYWTRLLEQIDALIGPVEIYKSREFEAPGKMKQNLFIREFWIQNMAALAVASDVLGRDLDASRRDRIRYLLMRAMRDYHDMLDDGDWWYGENPSNTIGVGNGCMGIIGLLMKEEVPELSAKTVPRALGNIRKLFLGVEPDGGCVEGAMYWNYGLTYPMFLGWSLRQTTGNDEGLLASPQVKNATQYLSVNFGGDGKTIPFNDNQPWLVGWPVLAAAGTEANSPLARWMADHMAATYAKGSPEPEQARATYTVPAFLYRDETPSPDKFPGLPNLATLESVQEAVLRSDGSKLVPAMVTGVKGKGAISTHHANQDQGSFVFYVDGEMVLLDPGYFQDKAQMHSLPLIGDAAKMVLNPTAFCPLNDAWENGALRSLTVDATAAYNMGKNEAAPLAQRARRVFVQVGEEALVVLDDTLPKEPAAPITAQYQAGVPVTVEKGSASLKTAKGEVALQTFGPELGLVAVPRQFSKDWIFKRSGVPWTTLQGEYAFKEGRPLVSVFLRGGGKAAVEYAGEKVRVTLPSGGKVEFEKTSGVWGAVKQGGSATGKP